MVFCCACVSINKLMNLRNTPDSPINQWLAGFNYVKESVRDSRITCYNVLLI